MFHILLSVPWSWIVLIIPSSKVQWSSLQDLPIPTPARFCSPGLVWNLIRETTSFRTWLQVPILVNGIWSHITAASRAHLNENLGDRVFDIFLALRRCWFLEWKVSINHKARNQGWWYHPHQSILATQWPILSLSISSPIFGITTRSMFQDLLEVLQARWLTVVDSSLILKTMMMIVSHCWVAVDHLQSEIPNDSLQAETTEGEIYTSVRRDTSSPSNVRHLLTSHQAIFAIELQRAAQWDFGSLSWRDIILEMDTKDTTWCTK